MISVTILTKNCQDTLKETLEAVKSFPEILILDSGSTDTTLEIAKAYSNVTIHTSPFLGFGPMHNLASSLAKYEWILSIDSDEVPSIELIQEIHNLILDPNNVYSILRHNFFNGKRIKWCGGWHPDPVIRLYCKDRTSFEAVPVHEKVKSDGFKILTLKHPMRHTPYRQISDFLAKMQAYTSLFAEQHQRRKRSSLFKAIIHGWSAFLKSYLFKKGFLGGREGFIISAYNGHTAFYKYLKLDELSKKR